MIRDLVCGRLIYSADALWVEYHGETYYFCSDHCKHEFEDRPDEYAKHPSPKVFDRLDFEPLRSLATTLQEVKEELVH
jgi:YHS domain-containing protein